jgi:hypothetical protein
MRDAAMTSRPAVVALVAAGIVAGRFLWRITRG